MTNPKIAFFLHRILVLELKIICQFLNLHLLFPSSSFYSFQSVQKNQKKKEKKLKLQSVAARAVAVVIFKCHMLLDSPTIKFCPSSDQISSLYCQFSTSNPYLTHQVKLKSNSPPSSIINFNPPVFPSFELHRSKSRAESNPHLTWNPH